jgi:hypothetical protein
MPPHTANTPPDPLRPLARLAFFPYALALFTATHWPALNVPGQEVRSDLIIHLICFGGWTILFTRCGWFAPWSSRRNLSLSALAAFGYAAFDEGTQAIPALRRVAAWDDLAANYLGVTTGTLACIVAAWFIRRNLTRKSLAHSPPARNESGGMS